MVDKPRAEVRLIDANALIEELLCSIYKTGFGGDGFKAGNEFGIRLAIESVESATTIDISEIKEKAWKYDSLCK